ncbi:MAG: hypothetical protein H7144_07835 [Burkholderiales bacterium]|nr:hypothetical protein [Phycisphaerae bacterium]
MLNLAKRLFGRSKSRDISSPRLSTCVLEQMEPRQLMASSTLSMGININDASTRMTKLAIPQLKALGVKSVRVWINPGSFNKRINNPVMLRAAAYKKAGFDVMAEVAAPNGSVTNPAAVKAWFKWAVSKPAWKNAIDRWQIGNEPDHKADWRGSMSQYVNLFLKPAAEALHAAGEKVVSAGPSWNPQDVSSMIKAGMLNHVDYVGYHPYSNSVKLATQRIAELKAVVGGRKPLVASEWNIRGLEGNKSAWANAVKAIFPTIRGNFAFNYYFGLIQKKSTKAGPGGVLTSGGGKTQFYQALAGARSTAANVISVSAAGVVTSSNGGFKAMTLSSAFSNRVISLVDDKTVSSSVL